MRRRAAELGEPLVLEDYKKKEEKSGHSQIPKRVFREIGMAWIKGGIPSSPGFGPHGRLVLVVWREVVAVEAIASVDLQ